ncbi:SMP-30/gluconolactonase/LRE family protein [Leucothrix arctica]|uniref:Gluconolactonase n=1 Tax=Leucothrix arctica TaxID=1481894 RepID=A0A317CIM2_9GAMM|nr:SMP-30/gluconolactonase/LRE family protein [Leucothrix arctica]PWQ96162.1 gluconolactonase [Leucothrix arctica]
MQSMNTFISAFSKASCATLLIFGAAYAGTEQAKTNPLEGMGELKVVASGFKSTEGPVWLSKKNTLLFTDIPGNTIYGLNSDTLTLEKVRSPSDVANGLSLDNEGYLLAAEQKNRSITRMNLTTKEVTPFIEAFEVEGKRYRFNSPNDMAVHANGNVYFTDPPFGLRRDPSKREIDFNGVFVRTPDGNIKVIKEMAQTKNPNGIIFSPNQSTMYLAVSDDESGPILAFDVDAKGELSNEREFARAQNTDGMAMDADGNLYVATRTGIKVWSSEGKEWGRIDLPNNIRTTNCAFGGKEKDTLYITNRSADLYAIKLKVKGHQ